MLCTCRKPPRIRRSLLLLAALLSTIITTTGPAGVVTLKNGLQIEGKLGKIAELGENPLGPASKKGPVRVTNILLVDDDLRRVFVSTNNLGPDPTESEPISQERIAIQQRVAKSGRRVGAVGPIINITPWDDWGRRIFSMNTPRGTVDIIQAITLITPTYCKVEGHQGSNSYVWDMRIATSSIPRNTLSKILMKQLDPENPADRLKIVRLYIQAERFEDARAELEQVIEEFPDLRALDETEKELRQYGARRIIKEIELRRDAGQHALAINWLQEFPADGVAGETLLKVRDILREYETALDQRRKVFFLFQTHLAEIKDAAIKARIEPLEKEINSRLNANTLDRMADYLRLADDNSLTAQQKLALAISGWILGSGSGTENLAVALDLIDVRHLVREYLTSAREHERNEILEKLQTLEGSQPSYLAKVLRHMTPAVKTEWPQGQIPGFFELTVPGLTGEPNFTYFVQLPPEYDPQRLYPCIVTLNGAGTTPQQQIDWWAGSYDPDKNMRLGQATRRGYVVIAPVWTAEKQARFNYTAREHAAVLYCLRDACRRFSLDTDRVFLSGHSMGGDAAWDLGLAHPDLWAGVVPVVATADKYISRYWENARNNLPFYFVSGEMDGDRLDRNKMDLNRYLRYVGFDVVVVEYQGRGHEHFHDEIQHLFQWMQLLQRDFGPRQFEVVAMRPWDNFFWWAELEDYPENTIVYPLEWPRKGAREARTEGKILLDNTLQLSTAAGKATIWLTPDMVNFDQRVTIVAGRRRQIEEVQPSAKVMLDDVRSRGDRKHPFWAKVEVK